MIIPLFNTDISVRWRDLDAFNHINNANYLGYIEEARVRWLYTLIPKWTDEPALPILAAITVNYRRPIGWPETLRIELFAERIGNKSLTVGHRVFSTNQPDDPCADGHTVLVWVNRDGQSVALPQAILAACTAKHT